MSTWGQSGGVWQANPQDLLAQLRSSTKVREVSPASFGRTVRKIEITFGDFGLPVSVSPPPARATFVPPGG